MKPSIVEMLRAHLLAASLAAACMDASAVAAIVLFHVPGAVFESRGFRLGAVGAVALGTFAVRRLASHAFRRAVRHAHAWPATGTWPARVSRACPSMPLVVLHLRLTGKPYALVDARLP